MNRRLVHNGPGAGRSWRAQHGRIISPSILLQLISGLDPHFFTHAHAPAQCAARLAHGLHLYVAEWGRSRDARRGGPALRQTHTGLKKKQQTLRRIFIMKSMKPIIIVLAIALTAGSFAFLQSGCSWFKKGAPTVEQAAKQPGNTPLHTAVIEGNIEDARTLVQEGADVNAANEQGNTPLHFAATAGSADFASLLVTNGADKSVKNKDGQTPMDVAKAAGHENMASILEGDTVDLNSQSQEQEESTGDEASSVDPADAPVESAE